MIGLKLLPSQEASCSFNQVVSVRPGENSESSQLALRESSGFSRQADRADNASQKNRDLFVAHSDPTDEDFQILSLYLSHPLLDLFLCQIFSLQEIYLLSHRSSDGSVVLAE